MMNESMINESMISGNNEEQFKSDNIVIKKSKKTKCKTCIKKSLLCGCCLSILVFTHYIAFNMGFIYCQQNQQNDDYSDSY